MGAVAQTAHIPVLLDEVLETLRPHGDGIFVDCTFGRGGHTRALLALLGPQAQVLALDRDPDAIAAAGAAPPDPRLKLVQAPFSRLSDCAGPLQLRGRVQGVLFDLGISSPQVDEPRRGFSFRHDGPLDMRMDPGAGESAAQFLARAPETEIADCLHYYGEERHARRIARAIVGARARAPLLRTAQLAAVIAQAHPAWQPGIHPATRSFQALRILVNNELGELKAGLLQAIDLLMIGGRLAVISFHSLEDRIVKQFIAQHGGERGPRLAALGSKRRAGAAELAANPRARSAVLRAAERRA